MSQNGAPRIDVPREAPARASLVLASLIIVAAVANLNVSVANVALPAIGKAFDSSQTALNLIAVGYSLGLAASVLCLGAVGDRHGRKLLLLLGIALSIPACLLAAGAPTDTVLVVARILGGLSAGMAYPTTLALITALWAGAGRTKAIALWAALGGGISMLGPDGAGLAGLADSCHWRSSATGARVAEYLPEVADPRRSRNSSGRRCRTWRRVARTASTKASPRSSPP
ncbi:MFS transporter [Streptomyces sp. NBC_00233]|uniref:MFS transporter n=1 Tax=Streptomyces sp. NBC_00233 TaxID=2975686 RepID=UPI00224D10C0|nr:MFS transporter [Streptomyces sp. NBC_00233]MCX5232156.1 MFS transporter [Streptomyces sp. NBC_00233]